MNCEKCSGDMELQDSHYSYVSPTNRVAIKYYKCLECGNEMAIEE
ncbi:hypothetical protein [His 1 virus]|uniref:Uncharacterized protein ORF1 n=1 Tax=His1 virus (isolate Australia/Victoria) TaxID=654912 RepID=Y001_HIS1I|nr:hypothetical protein His1V_gp01 [His 1 virus]Q25BJ4.1 RecName: Full=Uncharacterized protein ORF1 [His1 virus (isolate Victoria)]AAQ13716.1 hypothetical protein [His 1 virus]